MSIVLLLLQGALLYTLWLVLTLCVTWAYDSWHTRRQTKKFFTNIEEYRRDL